MICAHIAHSVQAARARVTSLAMIAAIAIVPFVAAGPARAEFAVAKDDRAAKTGTSPNARVGQSKRVPKARVKRLKPVAVPTVPPVAPVAVVPLTPPPPAVRPIWPAPAGWALSQTGAVCTLQTAAGDSGVIRLLDWKTREFTLQDLQDGLTPEVHAQLQIDLAGANASQPAAKPSPASAVVGRMELQIGEARFALQTRAPGEPIFRASVTPALLAALAGGGKARLTIDGRKGTKFRIADGAAALAALDACMANARMQPLSSAAGRAR